MIENQKQYTVTKSQQEMLRATVATFDIEKVAKKVGSKKLAEMELRALKGQIEELSAEIKEYEAAHGPSK